MNLPDRLHCPDCHGRLSNADCRLSCSKCGRTFPLVGGIVDFLNGRLPLTLGSDLYRGVAREEGLLASNLAMRVRTAAGSRWPAALGDMVEFGAGPMTQAVVRDEIVRSILVVDSDRDMLVACRQRLPALEPDFPIWFATLDGGQSVIRDAVMDTVAGSGLLPGIGDVRAFLTLVHRVLKPGGRALFVVPNRRYYQAICQALAEALVQRFAQDEAWPEGSWPVMNFLAEARRLILHRDDPGILVSLAEKHLFDSEALEDLGKEVGFAMAEVVPLDPDPAGGETMTRVCQDVGAPDMFARDIGALAAALGSPCMSLLSHQDQSALGLLWLTKASVPKVCIYSGRPARPSMIHAGPNAMVGGVESLWSVELLAADTPEGIVVTVGGWCLSNADVRWVRITLDDVDRNAPVWRHRPDVHEVLNRGRNHHPWNALCSGIESELRFTGVHPEDAECPLRIDIVLANGMIMTASAPERLVMDAPVVVTR